jgi:DNA topoisomerase-1
MQFTDRYPEIRRTQINNFVYRKTRTKVPSKIVDIIFALHIPKDYKTLWVSENPEKDFLQAVALDSKNRKQYFYSNRWLRQQNHLKIKRMYNFALILPQLERRILRDTGEKRLQFSKDRVIAFMLRIIQLTNIRIGNKKYYDKYNSHGLCTIRKDQVKLYKNAVRINFIGKHSKEHDIIIRDLDVIRFIHSLKLQKTNQNDWLFVFESPQDQRFYRVSAQMVNDYLHKDTELTITCKDFRTLNANINFLKLLRTKVIGNTQKLQQNIKETIEEVCSQLNNTASVCKKSYIMDVIIDIYYQDPNFVRKSFILDILKLACKKSRKN